MERRHRQSGITLPQLLAIVAAIVLLFVLIFACLGSFTAAVRPTVTLTPATATVPYGGDATFTVRLEFSGVYDNNADSPIRVFIYEQEILGGDVLLDSTVVVVIPRGRRAAEQTFTLRCNVIGGLEGASGRIRQRFFDYDVYAEAQPIEGELLRESSDDVEVECRDEE